MASGSLVRSGLVGWLYLIALGHFAMAVAVTWGADTPWFASYHHSILAVFGLSLSSQAMELQLWWLALFGATLQAFALFMLTLIYFASRYRHASIWLLLASVILFWAPQDIFISIQKNVWAHVWVDLAAVIALAPPLFALWWLDSK